MSAQFKASRSKIFKSLLTKNKGSLTIRKLRCRMVNFRRLSHRLNWAVAERIASDPNGTKITKRMIAQYAGVSPAAVTYWFGDTNGIDAQAARRLAKFLQVDPVWLESGAGNPKQVQLGRVWPAPAIPVTHCYSDVISIPVVASHFCSGRGGFANARERSQAGSVCLPINWLVLGGFNEMMLMGMRVKGDSMESSLHDGDLVVVDTANTSPSDGLVFAVCYEGELLIRRLTRDAGEWWLTSDKSDRCELHRRVCRPDSCVIIGRIIHKESDVI